MALSNPPRFVRILGRLCFSLGALLTLFAITNLIFSSLIAHDIARPAQSTATNDPSYFLLAPPYLSGVTAIGLAASLFSTPRALLTEPRPFVILFSCLLLIPSLLVLPPIYWTARFCASFDILGYPVRNNTYGWLGPLPSTGTTCVDDIGKVWYWKCDDVSAFQHHLLGCGIWLRLNGLQANNMRVNLTVQASRRLLAARCILSGITPASGAPPWPAG